MKFIFIYRSNVTKFSPLHTKIVSLYKIHQSVSTSVNSGLIYTQRITNTVQYFVFTTNKKFQMELSEQQQVRGGGLLKRTNRICMRTKRTMKEIAGAVRAIIEAK